MNDLLSQKKSILFLCPGGIGDNIRFSGLVKSVLGALPHARAFLVTSSSAAADVCWDRTRFKKVWFLSNHSLILNKLKTGLSIRRHKPDLIVAAAGLKPDSVVKFARFVGRPDLAGSGIEESWRGKYLFHTDHRPGDNEYDSNEALPG